jgi:serine/threonine protein kinase
MFSPPRKLRSVLRLAASCTRMGGSKHLYHRPRFVALRMPSARKKPTVLRCRLVISSSTRRFQREHLLPNAGRCLHVAHRNVLLQQWQLKGRPEQKRRMLHRLERETAALARLEAYRSDAFPILYDAFRDPDDWNVYWAVLELVEAQTLETMADRFLRNRRFRESVVGQLDEAFQMLGRAGVIHRNIHESTILIRNNERLLLAGFEFCSEADAATIRHTRPAGRPIAPEAAEGKVDSRTDIYDTACMLLRLLHYSDGGDPASSAKKIKHSAMRSAFLKALSRSPKERSDNLEELYSAIKVGMG